MSEAHHFGAVGDGKTDDTAAILHAIANADGMVRFPRGDYLITRTIEIDTSRTGRVALEGSGGTAKLIMAGPGPAVRIVGTHLTGSADPASSKPEVWAGQRMPTVAHIEIEGRHADADGVELVGTMQATLTGVLIREARHGVLIRRRNRNIVLQGCHVYHNRGVGVFIDGCNLHQVNITGCHISYNRLGGVRIERSEVRNLQVTGNDIEYNNHKSHGTPPEPTAEIHIDTTATGSSVREVTVASNTIQATYSPGGANVRILGPREATDLPPGMWTITGNVIGNQEVNVHLAGCRGVTLTGNFIYSGAQHNLLAERCRNLLVGHNTFGHNFPEWATGIRLDGCEDCVVSGVEIADTATGRHTEKGLPPVERQGLVELHHCRRVNVTGCNILNGLPFGIDLLDCELTTVQGCQLLESRDPKLMQAPVRWRGEGRHNRLCQNTMTGRADLSAIAGVVEEANTVVG